MTKATLVLEGGAVRGVFSAGVLDYLMEQDLYLSHVIGVSMGACNAVDYIAKQPERSLKCMMPRKKENIYINGVKKMVKEKSIMDMDMVFDKYPYEIFPFDFESYFASEITCDLVTTNVFNGKAEYMDERADKERLMKICRASSSMPLVTPMVRLDGKLYMDGGVADSIPIQRALDKGNEKIVVVLTRNPGYRKGQPGKATSKLYERAYKSYPAFVRAAIDRNEIYNQELEMVEQLEEEGKIFVIRPLIPAISRMEQDHDAILHFYNHGYRQMKRRMDELKTYLEIE